MVKKGEEEEEEEYSNLEFTEFLCTLFWSVLYCTLFIDIVQLIVSLLEYHLSRFHGQSRIISYFAWMSWHNYCVA